MTAEDDDKTAIDSGTTTGDGRANDGETGSERAFVLGLDGIPWYLIEQWAAAGELPHFARMIEEGAAGPLRSTTPATTALAWPSIATGVGPDKHGIYGFQKLSGEHTHRMYLNTDVRQPELWDVLSPAAVGNVPMTYPASEIDGELVAGMMTPDLEGTFTHPPEFSDEIRRRIPAYQVGLDWSDYAGREREFARALSGLVGARRKLMRLLMEREDWRLFFFVYTAPDRLQHLVWDEDVLLDHYRELDDILGEVMEYANEHEANLFVVSDHGFGPISTFVSVNRIFENEGYLVRRRDGGTRGLLSDLGVTKSGVMSALKRVGIDDKTLVEYLPQGLLDATAKQIPGEHALYDVDFGETRVFFHGSGTVYVNDTRRFANGTVDPADVPALKRDVEAMLSRVVDPETGERALDVYDGVELFPADENAPDLVVRGREEYQTIQSITDEVFTGSGTKVASHRSEGIFLATGPDVAAGTTPENAHVVDVAPTLLHTVGEPIPENADGRVLTELFDPESGAARRPVETRAYTAGDRPTRAGESEDNADYSGVEDRLRGLGYLE
jgi:predicted AlkP superfamily phosphohydrolase/phosphomutase